MKKLVALVASSLSLVVINANAAATPGVAGELGLHKTERLVALKKIDASFLTQTVSLTASATGAGFSVMLMEGNDSTGKARMLMMTSDKDGKVLTYKEMAAGVPASPVALPIKNALTMLELTMHCTEGELISGSDVCKKSAFATMYGDHFKSASLALTKDATGKITGAEVSVQGDGLAKTMVVALANDGSLVSLTEK